MKQALYKNTTVLTCAKLMSVATFSLALLACGGGETQNIQETINGPGGVYFGAFVEREQTLNPKDIDIGGMYLDIPTDITGSVKGGMSYQVYDCQDEVSLEIDGQKTRERLQVTFARGDVDPRASANGELESASQAVTIALSGGFSNNASAPKPWGGNYDVNADSTDKTRISPECNNQTYTFADNGVWSVYPANTLFGIKLNYDGASNTLSWVGQPETQQTLIMELDTSRISSGSSAFIKQIVQDSALSTYNPTATSGSTTVVVQTFNEKLQLIGFDTLVIE